MSADARRGGGGRCAEPTASRPVKCGDGVGAGDGNRDFFIGGEGGGGSGGAGGGGGGAGGGGDGLGGGGGGLGDGAAEGTRESSCGSRKVTQARFMKAD